MPTRRPTKNEAQALVEALGRYMYSTSAPIHDQQRLYKAYRKIFDRLLNKYPGLDLTSPSADEEIRARARTWWYERATKGAGVDW